MPEFVVPLEWSSGGSPDFLQERIAKSRLVFLVSLAFFGAGWLIDLADRMPLEHRLPLEARHLFQLGSMALVLAMWMAARGRPLPADALRLIDAVGTFLNSSG